MKITIITSTYNCSNSIEETIESIRQQKECFSEIQWIVVDGNSTDNTVERLSLNKELIDVLISENDSGIYDAWNKAIPFIKGEWVIFMGAGDVFLRPNTLINAYQKLKTVDSKLVKIVYGGVQLVNAAGECIDTYIDVPENDWSNGRPALPPHQGTFQHISLFEKNKFDVMYKIAADSKFLFLCLRETKMTKIDMYISKMEFMGVSTNPKLILKTKNELKNLRRELSLRMPFHLLFLFNLKCYTKHVFFNYFNDKSAKVIANGYRWVTGRGRLY